MADKADVAKAIDQHPQAAAAALLAIQAEKAKPLTLAGYDAIADPPRRTVGDVLANELYDDGRLDEFVTAMAAQGVIIDSHDTTIDGTEFSDDVIARGRSFPLSIRVKGEFSGSGCLIGPSLALTAWHVIADKWAGRGVAPAFPPVEVELSDHAKRHVLAKPVFYSSCTQQEYENSGLPTSDDQFKDFIDVALIKLERPDGIRLGFARLPCNCRPLVSGSAIALFHFPAGQGRFYSFGTISKFRNITARWRHSAGTTEGSSGGACFNTKFELVGLHQGKWEPGGRLVPASQFVDKIRPHVERDIAPTMLWSLDGTIKGPLVIGRDLFFEAVAAAARWESRVRGVRVKRHAWEQGATGLAFSLDMVRRVLARNPGAHAIVRVGFEATVPDLLNDMRRRAIEKGIDVREGDDAHGAGGPPGGATLEAALNERAAVLAAQLNDAAERTAKLIWILFDNPPASLADADRLAFEAFIGAVLRRPRLRIALAGFETMASPGAEFQNAGEAEDDGPPGLVVEFLGYFGRGDVEQLLKRACADFGANVSEDVIADRANQILQGLNSTNGQYSTSDLKTVSERAAVHLDYLRTLA